MASDQALGRSQGSFSTKLHLRADGQGKPLTLLLSAEQCHEAPLFEPLMAPGAIQREGRPRPRTRPKRIVADKGYSSHQLRRYLHRRRIRSTIPYRRNERWTGHFNPIIGMRNRVERVINQLKQFRRVATRYEK